MDFFGVLPDFSVRWIEVSDKVDPELKKTFQDDIRKYQKLESRDFYPEYKPEKGENLKLDDFRLPVAMERGMTLSVTRRPLSPKDVRPHGVKAIVAAETERTQPDEVNERGQRVVKQAAFKRLDKSRIIDQSVLRLVWDKNTFDRIDGPGMTVGEGLDALYDQGTLYFNNHLTASGFLDLTDAFSEASAPQIEDVLSHGILSFDGEGSIHDFVNQTNKRAISMLWRSGRLASLELEDVKTRAQEYEIDLRLEGLGEDERIMVPESNKEFKVLLDLLNQNYFPGIFDGEHYVANSKRPRRPQS